MKAFFFILFQYLVPQHALTRLAGWFARTEIEWLKDLFITKFIAAFDVNMSEAHEENPKKYASFNDFFVRELKDGARIIANNSESICCPADGAISQAGSIKGGRVFQAKKQDYTTEELLGGDKELAAQFDDGEFITVYLSPSDYHRVHMPIGGKLLQMNHIPGDLFSVNQTTAENVPRLFARNERIAAIFETAIGPMAVVMVGAMIVRSIDTVWSGSVAPIGTGVTQFHYTNQQEVTLKKGDEMGRFKLGSTAIVLFPKNTVEWNENINAGQKVRMGEEIGKRLVSATENVN